MRVSRVGLGLLMVAAALAVIASRDAWFTEGPGFFSPSEPLAWVIDGAAAVLALCALAALLRRSPAFEHLAAMGGLMLAGGLLLLLVAVGGGTDEPDRGAWLAAVAAAAAGGSGVALLSRSALGGGLRAGVVVLVVAAAAAAVLLPPDWSHPEVQIIR